MQLSPDRVVSALGAVLRAAGFRVGPAQHIDARRILAQLVSMGKMPSDLEELAAYLAPIYCAGPEQQQRFPDLLRRAMGGDGASTSTATTNRTRRRRLPPGIQAWLPVLAGGLVLSALAMALAYLIEAQSVAGYVVTDGVPVAGARVDLSNPPRHRLSDGGGRFEIETRRLDWPPTMWFGFDSRAVESRPQLRADKPGFLRAEVPVGRIDDQSYRLELRPIPPAEAPPPPAPSAGVDLVYTSPPVPAPPAEYRDEPAPPTLLLHRLAAILLPVALFLAWWAHWVLKRRAWLQRLPGRSSDDIKDLSAGARRAFALSLGTGAVAHELRRRHWQPSARLNVEASIRASLRRVGEMRLVFGSRVEPEYLVLIDESRNSDHMGRLGDALMLAFENRDVALKRYYFKDSPLTCDGPAREKKPREAGLPLVPLDVLHGGHGHCRLIVVSDGQSFFDPLSGQFAPGLELLLQWPNPTLLTPTPVKDWGRREWVLSYLGFAVLPLSLQGLALLGELVGSEKPVPPVPAQEPGLPSPGWLRDDTAFLMPAPPHGVSPEALMEDLHEELGEDAYLWLQACAAYPEVHWGLTLRLGAGLLEDDRRFADALPRISRLAWMRRAYLPTWLRDALTRDLSPENWGRVAAILQAILTSADEAGRGDIPLRIAAEPPPPDAGWKRLARLFRPGRAGAGGPPGRGRRDTVYLRFLQGPPHLAVPAVEAIKRFFFRDGLWTAGIRALPAGTVALAATALLGWQWPPVLRESRPVLQATPQPPAITALAMTGGAEDPILAGYSDGSVRLIQRGGAMQVAALKGEIRDFAYADASLAVARLASGNSRGFALRSEVKAPALGEFPFLAVVRHGPAPGDYAVTDQAEGLPRAAFGDGPSGRGPVLCAVVADGGDRRVTVTRDRLFIFDGQGNSLASIALPNPAAGCGMSPGAETIFGWNETGADRASAWRFRIRAGQFEPLPIEDGDSVRAISAARDGGRFWLLRGKQVEALDGGSGRRLATLPAGADAIAAGDDGRAVAIAANGAVQVWRLLPAGSEGPKVRRVFLAITAEYGGTSARLSGTYAETEALRKVLVERYGYEAIVLKDVSKSEVEARFETLARTLNGNDQLVVFFNGHSQKSIDGKGLDIYSNWTEPKGSTRPISSDEISGWLARMRPASVLTILDTSYARRARNGAAPNQSQSMGARLLLSSASEEEMAFGFSSNSTSSPFINAIVNVLKESKTPLRAVDVLKAVQDVLPNKDAPQTPNLDPMPAAVHAGGDFVFTPLRPATDAETDQPKKGSIQSAIKGPNGEQVRLLATLEGHTDSVVTSVFSPDGKRILTASRDRKVNLWLADGRRLASLPNGGPVFVAAFSMDGQRILTASDDKTVRLWRTDGQFLNELSGHEGPVLSATFSPDGERILTASEDGTARLWQANGRPLVTLRGHRNTVHDAAFSADGQRIVTASRDSTARLWRDDGKPIAELKGHTDTVWRAAFSPDGKRVVTASDDGTARLWRDDGQPLAVLDEHRFFLRHATFSQDGQQILTGHADGVAVLWQIDGRIRAALKGHSGPINSATFSPDGQFILTASNDGTARVWRVNGQPFAVLKGHSDRVIDAAFSPDGRKIVTASADKTARLWELIYEKGGTSDGPTSRPDDRAPSPGPLRPPPMDSRPPESAPAPAATPPPQTNRTLPRTTTPDKK